MHSTMLPSPHSRPWPESGRTLCSFSALLCSTCSTPLSGVAVSFMWMHTCMTSGAYAMQGAPGLPCKRRACSHRLT